VLVGGVGIPWAGDLDFGSRFVEHARTLRWPEDVEILDLALSGHRVLHLLRDLDPVAVILVAAYPRGGPPGTVRAYRPDGPLPSEEEIQERLGESASGVIDLDHVLVVARWYGALPADALVIEVEPEMTSFADELSPVVTSRMEEVLRLVREAVRTAASAGHAADTG
jgi:hydrogenase maturation protease